MFNSVGGKQIKADPSASRKAQLTPPRIRGYKGVSHKGSWILSELQGRALCSREKKHMWMPSALKKRQGGGGKVKLFYNK